MTSEQLIIEVKKKKFPIIIATVLIFLSTFFLQYRVLQTFHASSSIIVNETDVTDLHGPSEFIGDYVNASATSVNRLFKLVYSSEMMNHLIKTFRLYEYYQVDPASEFAYERVVGRLSGRISLKKVEQSIIDIEVTDRDRFQAASIANEIATMLNTLNENYIKSQLRRKVKLYEAIYIDAKNELEAHENKMDRTLSDYKNIMMTLERNKSDVETLKFSLIDLTNSLKNKREEFIKMKQLYSVMLNTLEKEHMDTITIINIAMPDYHSNTNMILIGSLAFSLLAACAMILLLNVYLTHQKAIHLLFQK
ncbi:MAG TPA: hypothetical protein VJY62_01910 [Bacteroidia bacterium]|nr:hypothetical protein [Bacteroidia bacterium]